MTRPFVAALAVGVALLAGCSSDEEASPETTTPTSQVTIPTICYMDSLEQPGAPGGLPARPCQFPGSTVPPQCEDLVVEGRSGPTLSEPCRNPDGSFYTVTR